VVQHNTVRAQLEGKVENEAKLHEEISNFKTKVDTLEEKLQVEGSKSTELQSEVASLNTYIQQKTEYASAVESQLELKQEMLQALQNDLQVQWDSRYTCI
jgi:chromosome segregation ATPase